MSSWLWEACERVQRPADHRGRSLARRWDDRFGPLEPPPTFGAGTGRAVPRADSNHMLERSRVRCSAAPGAWPSWACHSRFSLPEWQAGQQAGWMGAARAPLSSGPSPTALNTGPATEGRPRCWPPIYPCLWWSRPGQVWALRGALAAGGRPSCLVVGGWPGVHTGCAAPGQAGEGREPQPCQPSTELCRGRRRPRLICTLSASDRDASQVRTHRHPPWEGCHGQ